MPTLHLHGIEEFVREGSKLGNIGIRVLMEGGNVIVFG